MGYEELRAYYEGKRVFVTGHTGFKGSWLSLALILLGAKPYGYSLAPPTDPSLFEILGLKERMRDARGDVREYERLREAFQEAAPDCVFHLAAQPIVRDAYRLPRETYETNVMGTVNLMECVRQAHAQLGQGRTPLSVLNVTTDKVYENSDIADHPFREEEKLDGFDPYSNSKSCSELVTHSYKRSFFTAPEEKEGAGKGGAVGNAAQGLPRISTARAGNVIGGGDFAHDRILPDCVRDTMKGEAIRVRNPYSTRPYQHVLEPVLAYLMIVARQAADPSLASSYNVGPDREDAITTGDLADLFVKSWGGNAAWQALPEANAVHEASYLMLDCGKLKQAFAWKPAWHVQDAVRETVAWYRAWQDGQDMYRFTEGQIRRYMAALL